MGDDLEQGGGLGLALRAARERIGALEGDDARLAPLLEQLDRDLLPRFVGGASTMLVGIVGPNNAGKSALFNALVGRPASLSGPTGGATRRLVGGMSAALLDRLLESADGGRLQLSARPQEPAGAQGEGDPAALGAIVSDVLPDGLLLVDTPDFDSIYGSHRQASETFLGIADLVVVVVTRHSYQNREVIDFLRHWLQFGRPWVLVYNEAPSEEIAVAHAGKLAEDLGAAPLAVAWAPLSLEVQAGTAVLEPRVAVGEGAGQLLRDLLFDVGGRDALKRKAMAASLDRFREALDQSVGDLRAEIGQVEALEIEAHRTAEAVGRAVASAALPAGPFIEAFRRVLDERSNSFSRGWRSWMRAAGERLANLPTVLFGGDESVQGAVAREIGHVEEKELERRWPEFWEQLRRELGPEAKSEARRAAPDRFVTRLDDDLADSRGASARAAAAAAISTGPVGFEEFATECERLVAHAIDERGYDWDIRVALDLLMAAPIAVAAVLIVNVGGVGSDVVLAGGGAASSFLVERYSHLLGAGITTAAQREWTRIRGVAIRDLLLDAALPATSQALRASAGAGTEALTALEGVRAEIG